MTMGAPAQGNDTTDVQPGRTDVKNLWSLMSDKARRSALFQYDQIKLRFQYAIVRDALPKKSWWKRKSIKRDIERLFDDVDEEIYFEEKLSKEVKGVEAEKKKELARLQKSRENLEEVLVGYDNFTVQEERKIKAMTDAAMKRLVTREMEAGRI
ncbi:MAG: hypothetical protein PHG85_06545 [Candidatus Altiarchaeota archaeon]|nr:hypothetical protein [Candidatus Altiarchaeota archaeon]